MSQIGEPIKVVDIPRPEVAPVFVPPKREPEAEPLYDIPEPIKEPIPVPVRRSTG